MIARLINHACSWWCEIPGWPLLTMGAIAGSVIGLYWWAWSR